VNRLATTGRPYQTTAYVAPGDGRAPESKPRYHVYMPAMRAALVIATTTLIASPALADRFGGFSGVDRPYLVDQDRICKPLEVKAGVATGQPSCEKAGADVIARLSIKDPLPQSGAKAAFTATAQGRTLTVARKSGEPIVTWQSIDPIGKVVEVYASQYEDRIAVAYNVRRMGRDVVAVVAFDLLGKQPAVDPKDPAPLTTPTTPAPPEDPKLAKAVAAARKLTGAKAVAAWKDVLAIDAQHSEAMFRLAAAQVAAKQRAEAVAQLEALGRSSREDAIEWLVEARFDKAFTQVRAEPKFRAAVGLDKKPSTTYERVMGYGGQWEQTGTSCDKPEVRLQLQRDRKFKLRIKTACQGAVYDTPFAGTWRIDGTRVVLMLPTKGKVTADDEAPCLLEASGDEDALRCTVGRDLDFIVLPARR
jgi:hypothetical protein